MTQADTEYTPPAAPLTSGETALAISATIDRMKKIAADSGDRLYLSDGPPHPDFELLDLCGELLHNMKRLEALWTKHRKMPWQSMPSGYDTTSADRAANHLRQAAIRREMEPIEGRQRTLFSRVRKLKATTGAGIYAKALVCRHSETGAAKLAMSLAEDLVNAPHLRATLWADEGGQAHG